MGFPMLARLAILVIVLLAATILFTFRLILVTIGSIIYVYLLPGVLAEKKNYPGYPRVYLWCALTGWLILPWIAALVWVSTAPAVEDENIPRLEW